MLSDLSSHYKVVLDRRGLARTVEMEPNQRLDQLTRLITQIFPPLKLESQRMKILTMNFSNAINRRRTIDFSMLAFFLFKYDKTMTKSRSIWLQPESPKKNFKLVKVQTLKFKLTTLMATYKEFYSNHFFKG